MEQTYERFQKPPAETPSFRFQIVMPTDDPKMTLIFETRVEDADPNTAWLKAADRYKGCVVNYIT